MSVIKHKIMQRLNMKLIIGLAIMLMAWGCDNSKPGTSSLFPDMDAPRSKIRLDQEWKFHLGDLNGGEAVALDDESWRILDLPHDWSIEDVPGTGSPLDSSAIGGIDMGY